MQKKYLFIINPVSGNGKVKRNWEKTRLTLQQAGLDFDFQMSEYKNHAIEIAQLAVLKGYRYIVAVGGDGTNNEVINGIMSQEKVAPDTLFYTLLPLGTGNDWVKTHAIPLQIKEWLPMLQQEKTMLHDIGKVDYTKEGKALSRYFINVAGMSYDGYVAKYVENRKSKYFNQLFYLFYIFRCLFLYKLQPTKVVIDKKTEVKDKFYTLNIGICKYSGGGMQFVPHANPSDRQFALTAAGNLSKWNVITALPFFYNGKIAQYPKVTTYHCKDIQVKGLDTPILLEADGEFLGETPVSFSLCERRLKVIVP